jgi:branched-chain amino acid transport system substrate-binding protein
MRQMQQKWAGVALAALVIGQGALPVAASAQAPVQGPTVAMLPAGQARLDEAFALLARKDWNSALTAFTPLVNTGDNGPRGQARYGMAIALDQLGRPGDALTVLEGTLADNSPLGRAVGVLRGELTLQASELALNEDKLTEAKQRLDQYDRLTIKPNAARAARLRAALEPAANPSVARLRIGVLVPQRGDMRTIGEAVVRGLQLGIQDFAGDGKGVELELWPTDVTTADEAQVAAATLIQQQVDVVVGPVLAAQVTAVATLFRSKNIPLLVLTSDRSTLGPNVHTLNYLPSAQAQTVTDAALAAGKRRFAALVPQGLYGEEALAGLRMALEGTPGTLVRSVIYDPQATDIGSQIRDLAGQGVDFDALLLPAAGRTLPLLSAQLAYHDLDKANVALLGTALWQDPAVLAASANLLRGGLFASPVRADALNDQFTQAFGQNAHPLSLLGYDAARVLADVAREKQRTGNAISQLLRRPEGFYGVGGYLRFGETGATERGLGLTRIVRSEQGPTSVFQVEREGARLAPLPLPTPLRPNDQPAAWW